MGEMRRKDSGNTDDFTDIRIGTYNILITIDKELAENFSNYNRFSVLRQDLEREVAKANRAYLYGDIKDFQRKSAGKRSLVLLSSDVNMLELTHEMNFGGEGGDSNAAPLIKLKSFEPGLEILKKFYYLFLGEKISEIKFRKNELEKLSKRLDSVAAKPYGELIDGEVVFTSDEDELRLLGIEEAQIKKANNPYSEEQLNDF